MQFPLRFLAYLLARFSEPSSYAGLGAVLALLGVHFSDSLTGEIAQSLAALCALAALLLKERGIIKSLEKPRPHRHSRRRRDARGLRARRHRENGRPRPDRRLRRGDNAVADRRSLCGVDRGRLRHRRGGLILA